MGGIVWYGKSLRGYVDGTGRGGGECITIQLAYKDVQPKSEPTLCACRRPDQQIEMGVDSDGDGGGGGAEVRATALSQLARARPFSDLIYVWWKQQ